MEDNKTITRVWRDNFNENTKKVCHKCGEPLSKEWIAKNWNFCGKCNKEWATSKNKNTADEFSKEIRTDYYDIINGLKSMVSHNRKGKPQKQQWGMHIVNPCKDRNNEYYKNKFPIGQ